MVKANQDFVTAVTGFSVKKDDTFEIVTRTRGLYKVKLAEDLVSDWFAEENELFTLIG